VRLYIFYKFHYLFLITVFPNSDSITSNRWQSRGTISEELIKISKSIFWVEFNSLKELDSIQNRLHNLKKCLHLITGSSKVFTVTENNTQEELLEKFLKSFCIICQILFLFMPFFAFNLWVSTTKTMVLLWSWHFTLHYFRSCYWFSYCSFLLIKSCLCFRNQVFLVFLQELLILWDLVGWSIIFIRHTIAFTKHDWFPSWKAVF
jgi:hypothetical protein